MLIKDSNTSSSATKLLLGFVIIIILYLLYIMLTTGPMLPTRGRPGGPAELHRPAVMPVDSYHT